MEKDNYNFECPFCECYDIVCKNELNLDVVECPIQLRGKCEADIVPTEEDKVIIKETWNKLKSKDRLNTYKKNNPLYYSTVPSLQANCPLNYDWDNCSSKEYGLKCRTCCDYNPLRMLYEQTVNGVKIAVPKEILLDDCRVQLEKGE